MRSFLALPASVLALASLSCAAPLAPVIEERQIEDSGSANPVFVADFPDPSLLQANNQWYAYATNHGATHVQLATSNDFHTWVYHPGLDVMPQLPSWVNPTSSNVWAPKVWQRSDNTYVLYYSALHNPINVSPGVTRGTHCIGAATATNPQGPFIPVAGDALICPAAQGGAIDPSHFRDSNGQNYIVYKVDGNSIGHGGSCGNTVAPIVPTPIMLQKVAADGITLIGAPQQILDRDGGDGPLIEAPSMARMADGKYYLFYSSNCWNSPQYDVGFAVADAVAGPYTKTGVLLYTGLSGLVSPGGAEVSNDGERIVFHGTYQKTRTLFAANLGKGTQGSATEGFKVTVQ